MINVVFAIWYLIIFTLYLYNSIFNDYVMTFELWLTSIIYLVPYSYQLLRLRISIKIMNHLMELKSSLKLIQLSR